MTGPWGGVSVTFQLSKDEMVLVDEIRSWGASIDFAVEHFLRESKITDPNIAAGVGFVIRVLQNGWPKEEDNFQRLKKNENNEWVPV